MFKFKFQVSDFQEDGPDSDFARESQTESQKQRKTRIEVHADYGNIE